MNKHFRLSSGHFSSLEEPGVSASAVLVRAGLSRGYINQPRVLLKTEELFAFWHAVGEVSANPEIGLLLGTETKTERFHLTGLAALASGFGAAVGKMACYKQLTCPEEILESHPLAGAKGSAQGQLPNRDLWKRRGYAKTQTWKKQS